MSAPVSAHIAAVARDCEPSLRHRSWGTRCRLCLGTALVQRHAHFGHAGRLAAQRLRIIFLNNPHSTRRVRR